MLKRYYNSTLGYFLKETQNMRLAKSLTDTALVKAWLALCRGKYKEKHHFEGWLGIVCRNVWIDYLRKLKKAKKEKLDTIPLEAGEEVAEEPTITREEKRRRMGLGLRSLGRKIRLAVILFSIKKLPVTKVAKRLDVDEDTVYSYNYRGLHKLRMFF